MESNNNVPEFNRELIKEYLKCLLEKYDTLSLDPFSTRARLTVRREIEDMKSILAERDMEKTWEQLDKVFGCDNQKPKPKYPGYSVDDWSEQYNSKLSKKGKSSEFDEVI